MFNIICDGDVIFYNLGDVKKYHSLVYGIDLDYVSWNIIRHDVKTNMRGVIRFLNPEDFGCKDIYYHGISMQQDYIDTCAFFVKDDGVSSIKSYRFNKNNPSEYEEISVVDYYCISIASSVGFLVLCRGREIIVFNKITNRVYKYDTPFDVIMSVANTSIVPSNDFSFTGFDKNRQFVKFALDLDESQLYLLNENQKYLSLGNINIPASQIGNIEDIGLHEWTPVGEIQLSEITGFKDTFDVHSTYPFNTIVKAESIYDRLKSIITNANCNYGSCFLKGFLKI
ncbi:MAG: hypothetical protein WCH76_05705 [Candidatus Riflemargulisbacteria bacterium]